MWKVLLMNTAAWGLGLGVAAALWPDYQWWAACGIGLMCGFAYMLIGLWATMRAALARMDAEALTTLTAKTRISSSM